MFYLFSCFLCTWSSFGCNKPTNFMATFEVSIGLTISHLFLFHHHYPLSPVPFTFSFPVPSPSMFHSLLHPLPTLSLSAPHGNVHAYTGAVFRSHKYVCVRKWDLMYISLSNLIFFTYGHSPGTC